MYTLPEIRADYERLWRTAELALPRLAAVTAAAMEAKAHEARYRAVVHDTQIPWVFVAGCHMRESTFNFTKHLHNGDPLTARTKKKPKGRPLGTPPFTWEESARDAILLKQLTLVQDWTIPGLLYQWERFNGWGYRRYSRGNTPYLWSMTNQYFRGKYVADGKWSKTAVDQQVGCAALLLRCVQLGIWRIGDDPLIQFSLDELEHAMEYQRFCNTVPDIDLLPDGKPGPMTSAAHRHIFGSYLAGDPRDEGA